jgi:hypothetical protein
MRQKFDEDGLLEDKRHPNAYKKTKVPGPGHMIQKIILELLYIL